MPLASVSIPKATFQPLAFPPALAPKWTALGISLEQHV